MTFEQCYSAESSGVSAHPEARILIVTFVTFVAVIFFIANIWGLSICLLYLILLWRLAGLRATVLRRHARTLIGVTVLILLLNAILVDGRPLHPAVAFLSWEGLTAGIFYAMRMLILYMAVTMFLIACPQEVVARGLASLVRPFSPFLSRRVALHGFLAIGFLPLFSDEVERILTAQRFRGGGFDGGLRQRLSAVRLLLVPLFLSAIHRSSQLTMAVELRGIEQSIEEILIHEKPQRRDVAFAGVTVAVLALAFRLGGP